MIPNEFYLVLNRAKAEYQKNIPLAPRSSFRIGGSGEVGVFPKSAEELSLCLSAARRYGLKYHVIGKGSNLLFGDRLIEGVFIFTEKLDKAEINGEYINAEAGVSLPSLSAMAANASLSGLEFARGIPASVGGAVFMNAGAYGGQMSDIVAYTTALDTESGEIIQLTEHSFSYRESIYMKNSALVCLSARLCLDHGDKAEIGEKMREYTAKRREKQPLEFPSAGSYFKRPEGYFAGKLIEDCGLKGLCVGGAAVSEKHAGFVINLGNATAADVLELEKRVIDTVYEKFGVTLEREVRVIT